MRYGVTTNLTPETRLALLEGGWDTIRGSVVITTRMGRPCKVANVRTFSTVGYGNNFGAHNNDMNNVLRALYERVYHVAGVEDPGTPQERVGLVPPPNPVVDRVTMMSKYVTRRLVNRCRKVPPFSREEFLETYKGRKRGIYERAADAYKLTIITKQIARLQSFIKCEKVNFSVKPDPAPRIIQPRSPVYGFALGRYIKAIEHNLFKGISKLFGGKTVMKGMNARQQGRQFRTGWNKFKDPVAIGLDASRFDQHCSEAILSFEHRIYNQLFRQTASPIERRELAQLLQYQLDNVGRVYLPNGVIKYKIKGCRMSGDMNTSCGNCLIMCSLIYFLCVEKNIKTRRLFNNGDDCTLIIEREDLAKLPEAEIHRWFLEFGYSMKVEQVVDKIEQISFCQTSPIWEGPELNDYVMCRDPRIVLDKDLVTIKDASTVKGHDYYRRAIANSGLSLAGHLPVFTEFYRMMKRGTSETKQRREDEEISGMLMLSKNMAKRKGAIHPMTRLSFNEAFNMTPDEQHALEDYYSQQKCAFTEPQIVRTFGQPEHTRR